MTMHNQAADWAGCHVLVTGAAGFIGSHLTEALVRRGARVRAFVRYTSRSDHGLLADLPPDVLGRVEIVAGDLRDPHAVSEACRGATQVFHLGALIAIPYSYLHPAEVVQTNVMGTLNVLLAAREMGLARVIHISTSEVYGTAQTRVISEDHRLQGQSPYSASKIAADKLAESFYCAYDLPVVTVRPFNTYGPRQSDRAVIPTIITQALTQDQILLGNLDARRDLTYVADTVEGILRAGAAGGVLGETLNLGTGDEISIGELAAAIIRLVGRPVQVVSDPERRRPARSEVMRLRSDNRRATQLLGWQPQVPLEAGLQQTVEWVAAHLARYQIGRYVI
jgi:dTDP-glucose 4,6-dehydratase